MNKQIEITCPECGCSFSPDTALRKHLNQQVESFLAEEREKLFIEFEVKAATKVEFQIKDLQEQLGEKKKALDNSNAEQLLLRKQVRAADEKARELDLEVEKKVTEQVYKIEDEIRKVSEEKHRFELLQKEKKIQDMNNVIEELKRKGEQSSSQLRGEVVELDYEENLRQKFPTDNIISVAKGVNGADVVQEVFDGGKKCGTILWEMKKTKSFSKSWLGKLREDQRKAGANIAILVSSTMPKEYNDIEFVDGVYVVRFSLAIPFSVSLRSGLLDLARAELVATNRDIKMAQIYSYLTGTSFRAKFRSILTAYKTQRDDLDKERRALTRIWAKREKQLEIVIESAGSMYGDLEGIIGNDVPTFDELALPLSETVMIE